MLKYQIIFNLHFLSFHTIEMEKDSDYKEYKESNLGEQNFEEQV